MRKGVQQQRPGCRALFYTQLHIDSVGSDALERSINFHPDVLALNTRPGVLTNTGKSIFAAQLNSTILCGARLFFLSTFLSRHFQQVNLVLACAERTL